jgi:hypothetical protein
MITRSLVGCLFRLEHPKGGWQTRLVIYFQVIASDIYTTRLISTTYIYIHSIIMIRPNLCMGRRSSSWRMDLLFIAIVTPRKKSSFCLAGAWWRGRTWWDRGRDDVAGVVVLVLLCVCLYVAFLVIINDWPVEVWGDRRLSPAAGVGTAVDGLKGLTSGPVCCCSCLLLIPSSRTALTALLERWWDEPIDEAVHTTVSCCPLPKCSRVNLLMCNPTVVEASNTIVTALLPFTLLAPPDSVSTDDERQRVG